MEEPDDKDKTLKTTMTTIITKNLTNNCINAENSFKCLFGKKKKLE